MREARAAVPDDRATPQRRPGLARGGVQSLQDPREPAAQRHPPPAGHPDLEAGGHVEMPVMPEGPLRAAGAHDQADRDAGDYALEVGPSGRGALIRPGLGHQPSPSGNLCSFVSRFRVRLATSSRAIARSEQRSNSWRDTPSIQERRKAQTPQTSRQQRRCEQLAARLHLCLPRTMTAPRCCSLLSSKHNPTLARAQ